MIGHHSAEFSRASATDDAPEKAALAALAVAFAVLAILGALDLIWDLETGAPMHHVLPEAGLIVMCLGGVVWMALRLRALLRALTSRAQALEARLSESRAEAEQWRREAGDLIGGLSSAIDRQLDRWHLSPAEREVALLLLKGLSHKEVAEIRGVSEVTVRQQARSLYRKAGLSGRHDLAAFFLEDLLGPRLPRSSAASIIPES